MSRRRIVLIAGLLLLTAGAIAGAGYIGAHNREVEAVENGRQSEQEGGGSAPIAAFVAIFAAIIAASQARKSKQDGNKNG